METETMQSPPPTAVIHATNGDMLWIVDGPLCEYEPGTERLARLSDRFHAKATLVTGVRAPFVRICADCAKLPRFKFNPETRPIGNKNP